MKNKKNTKVKAKTKPKAQDKPVNKPEKDTLNPRQREFCKLYVTKEFFGNGTEAYIEAYNVDITNEGAYGAARSCASRLLTNANILTHINKLLDNEGLNDQFVDKQLLFLITQHADLPAKKNAITEYNKLKQRIINKIDIKSDGKPIQTELDFSKFTNDELKTFYALYTKAKGIK